MIGETIGSYRITAKLGEGGMGVVYLGEHQRIAKKAAIKVLLPEFSQNQSVVDRFFREALATSRIHHPGIVEILDCNLLPNGSAYIVMELLEGESLRALLRREQSLPLPRGLQLARHIADALGAAHDQQIIHRDLKPDNVFVLAERPTAALSTPIKVVDFGIAKLMGGESGQDGTKTRTGVIIGTPIYMSPEQCRGTGSVDHRSDIYSLGCILFEMLTGQPPFPYEGFGELIHAHLAVEPPSLRASNPSAPPAVEALIKRLLAKSAAERPQTMRDLVVELEGLERGGGASAPARARARPATGSGAVRTPPSAPGMATPSSWTGTVMMPSGQTTLSETAAEREAPLGLEDLGRPAKSRAPMLLVAAAMVLGIGGVVAWRVTSNPPSPPSEIAAGSVPPREPAPGAPGAEALAPPPPPAKPREVAEAPPPPPAAPEPAAPSAPKPAAAAVAPAAAKPIVAHAEGASTGGGEHHAHHGGTAIKHDKEAPVVENKVHVMIASDPPGADVCLASDRVLLGRTSLDWSTPKSGATLKFLIRKSGYRGQEISVSADTDARKRVDLDKLGPDDIDDVTNCRAR
jgi:serine/threonine-protein kinase